MATSTHRIGGFCPLFTIVYVHYEIKKAVSSQSMQDAKNRSIPVFTSDYALYWFDYLAGFDGVFVELGWNHSRTQQIGEQ